MANTSLNQTVWSSRLLYNLNKNLVYGNIASIEYEGDASQASAVRINSLGSVVVGDYTPGSDITILPVTSSYQDLLIDQKKYFAVSVDDVNKSQTNVPFVDTLMADGAYQLQSTVDSYIASLYTTMPTGSTLGNDTTPLIATGSSAYNYLLDAAQYCDENNIPEGDRFAVLPAWYFNQLSRDTRFTSNPKYLTNGLVEGETIGGFKLFKSNNVPNTTKTKYKVIFGHSRALAFAGGVREIKVTDMEKQFGQLIKGLYVFGAKVIQPNGLGVMTVNFA